MTKKYFGAFPKTLREFFKVGMDRDINSVYYKPEWDVGDDAVILNLGAGMMKVLENNRVLDWPSWDAESNPIPFKANSVDVINCHHFLEHIQNVIPLIADMSRVLKSDGVINITVPYYKSNMAHQDLDHKHTFTETTFKNLLENDYYKKHDTGGLKVNISIIIGVAERNLAVLIQLVKRNNPIC
jgi:SAM-dependent methyltransferase